MSCAHLSILRWSRVHYLTIVGAFVSASLSGCVVYEPVPAYSPTPSAFDRSWDAAVGAAGDIASADRASGVIRGTKDALDVTVAVRTQADGRVRVEFNAKGPAGQDAPLVERMSPAYDRRMGR